MKAFRTTAFVAALVFVGAVLGADAPKANLQLIMLAKVNPQGLALWDITNDAIGDDGDVDGKKITAAQWARLLEIGKSLEDAGRALATSNGIVAAPPGAKLQDEGNGQGSSAADVQRFVDAKPAVFRSQSLELQKTGAAIVASATKRDAKRLGDVANSLDQVCENCHVLFWYPNQKKLP